MPHHFETASNHHDAWLLLHLTSNLVLRCESRVFAQVGLTPQKHAVLMAVKHIEDPVTLTEVAEWLDRSTNGVSLLVDRMVKDGLVERARDLQDRRSVRLTITDKGERLLNPATQSAWALIKRVLSPLSQDELVLLGSMLQRVRQEASRYLDCGQATGEAGTGEADSMAPL